MLLLLAGKYVIRGGIRVKTALQVEKKIVIWCKILIIYLPVPCCIHREKTQEINILICIYFAKGNNGKH